MIPKIDNTYNYVVLHLKGCHSQGIIKDRVEGLARIYE